MTACCGLDPLVFGHVCQPAPHVLRAEEIEARIHARVPSAGPPAARAAFPGVPAGGVTHARRRWLRAITTVTGGMP
jgi:hypothetical protein